MRNSPFPYLVLTLLIVAVWGAALWALGQDAARGIVVIDGDTLDIGDRRIRLWGIDAPEIDTPEGKMAKKALWFLVGEGTRKPRCIERDTDQYGRTVAQCFTPKGTDIARWLVKEGYARDWPEYSGGFYAK